MPSHSAVFFDSLAKLEETREALHTALREAAFQYSATQRLEEQRGHLLGFEAVPTDEGTLSATCVVERCDAGEDHDGSPEGCWKLVAEDPQPLPSSSPPAAPGKNPEQRSSADVLYYFSAAPSHDLRECQRLYREALKWAVATVNAQESALSTL